MKKNGNMLPKGKPDDAETAAADWKNWKWQLKHAIRDINTFEQLTGISFSREEKAKIEETAGKFPISITPYYLSLINTDNYLNDPFYKQSFPDPSELIRDAYDMTDPLQEDKHSPVEGIVHRYPDRVLFLVSNSCFMYCRHCTRKRKVDDDHSILVKPAAAAGINYIRKTPRVRDVLISGGEPLMLSDEYLDWILTELRKIPHVEIIRIGTRAPAVLPYRVTEGLVRVLKKHQPLWINTHFNHPAEITDPAKESLRLLADGGLPLNNQSVLLAGVNDCAKIIKQLCHKLLQNRVRPYYLYQCDLTEGLSHFRTPVGKGVEIIENLVGHTSGLAVPFYTIDVPGGGGKIPVSPNYIVSWSADKVILRNYRGFIASYKEPANHNPRSCSGDCKNCRLQPDLDNPVESRAEGIAKLLSAADPAYTITPGPYSTVYKMEG